MFHTERFPPGPALEPWVEYLWTVDWDLGDAPAVESRVISFPALHLTAESGTPGEVRLRSFCQGQRPVISSSRE